MTTCLFISTYLFLVSPLIMADDLYSHKSHVGAVLVFGLSSGSLQDANKHEHGSGYNSTNFCVFIPKHLLVNILLSLYGSAKLCCRKTTFNLKPVFRLLFFSLKAH